MRVSHHSKAMLAHSSIVVFSNQRLVVLVMIFEKFREKFISIVVALAKIRVKTMKFEPNFAQVQICTKFGSWNYIDQSQDDFLEPTLAKVSLEFDYNSIHSKFWQKPMEEVILYSAKVCCNIYVQDWAKLQLAPSLAQLLFLRWKSETVTRQPPPKDLLDETDNSDLWTT